MKLPFNYGISKDDCNIVLTNQQYVCLEAYVLPLKTINATTKDNKCIPCNTA